MFSGAIKGLKAWIDSATLHEHEVRKVICTSKTLWSRVEIFEMCSGWTIRVA